MHEGHRKRMYEKLKNGEEALKDHELLEILLFNACPRKNTNPIAHELLQKFGTLSGVFNADIDQLVTVNGIGENIALYLKCVSECKKRISSEFIGIAVLKNRADFRDFTIARMRGRTAEVLEIYSIDKNGKIISVDTFSDLDKSRVEITPDKLSKIIATGNPHGILVAHNHLSGSSVPSESDDKFTSQIQLLCSIHNVKLYDHCIYASDNDIYSYYSIGILDRIKSDFTIDKVMDDQFKLLLKKK